ncbi:ATP-binding protein [Sphaerisporangium sp. NPDC049002]|uniref:ATP-binding protein n=1 Tax=unclassified Sphaerisporangium TaxID=2630420 RepID=UPI00340FA8D0
MIGRRLLAVTTASVAAALLVLTIGFWAVLTHGLDQDAVRVLRSRAEAAMTTVEVTPGGLAVEDPPMDQVLDDNTWVFDAAGRALARPRAGAALDQAATTLTTGMRDVGDARLLAVPVPRGGTVVVSVSMRPYWDSGRIALMAASALDLIVLGLVALLTRQIVRAALRPVSAMTRQALEWSEHDLDRRFSFGPARDELTGLAAGLDVLLDRVATNLRHERLLSAEIAHELRTPLARLRAEAEIALLRPRPVTELRRALDGVVTHTGELAQVVDTLLGFSRTPITSTGCRIGDAVQGPGVDFACDPGLRVSCERELVAHVLAPLRHNARAYGSTDQVTVDRDGSALTLTVTDDGPGVRPGEEELIFDPAHRGSASHLAEGSGLGLALARRLARASGGDVTALPGSKGRFVVRLPLA